MPKSRLTIEDRNLTVGQFRESGAMRRAILGGWGLDAFELKALESAYHETANPIFAFMAFQVSRRMDPSHPIPAWVLDLIGSAIDAYMQPTNKKGFDSLLGLKTGRGRTPAAKAAWRDAYQHYLCGEIARLRWIFKISISDAIRMVSSCPVESRRKQFTGLGIPRTVMHQYSESSLKDLFEKRYYKRFVFLKKLSGPEFEFSDEEKQDILAPYPPHSLPLKLAKNTGSK